MKISVFKNFFCAYILLLAGQAFGQTADQNYVKTFKALVPISGDLSLINNKSQVAESIEYYDGLGRPVQSIARENSPLGYDMVICFEYDAYGRNAKSFLPFASLSSDGNMKISPLTEQSSFYVAQAGSADGMKAFSIPLFENSELNRLLKQGSPGKAWQPVGTYPYSLSSTDHTIKKRYEVNKAGEVLDFKYNPGIMSVYLISESQHYPAGQLNSTRTIDERQHEIIEFVDKEGRTICKKVQYSSDAGVKLYASTYYIYDDLGNLVTVLSPEASKRLTP